MRQYIGTSFCFESLILEEKPKLEIAYAVLDGHALAVTLSAAVT